MLYDTVINHKVLMAYCKPKEEDFNPFKIKLCINKDYSTPTQTYTTNQSQRPASAFTFNLDFLVQVQHHVNN